MDEFEDSCVIGRYVGGSMVLELKNARLEVLRLLDLGPHRKRDQGVMYLEQDGYEGKLPRTYNSFVGLNDFVSHA